jgi:hypothetical protein
MTDGFGARRIFAADSPKGIVQIPPKFHPCVWLALYRNLGMKDTAKPVLHCNNTTVETTFEK